VHFRREWHEGRENAPQPQRIFAKLGPHPVVARGGGIAFVEDEVDDLEHRREPLGQRHPTRHLEGHARLGREHGVAGDEHQPQQIVADIFIERCFDVGRRWRLQVVSCGLMLRADQFLAAPRVQRSILRSGHQPGARIVRNAERGPLLQRDDHRVLRQLFRESDVAHEPDEACDEPRRLDAKHRLDRPVRSRIRHRGRLTHLPPAV